MKYSKVYIDDLHELYVELENEVLVGADAFTYINRYMDQTARRIIENSNDLVLTYKDALLDIKNYEEVFKHNQSLFKSIKNIEFINSDFDEELDEELRAKRVARRITRRNKYISSITCTICFNRWS